ncbi:hypothetical protein [Nocardioides sp. GY 10127]|uniref:hypothetical protein n=1 Tax=Nocardioides sp. GY 10127 TaxID=2569762 RepID=UPI0010A884AC|nr:hypothetical protein [Nocardioides sp. GY 10127]TIC82637.1 hypothetical protein E8D37_07995 [Nocardioides sp. GY 10127]
MSSEHTPAVVENKAIMSDKELREYRESLAHSYPTPGFSSVGVHLVLLVSVWLIIASYTIYSAGETGHFNALWSGALVTAVILPALWLRQVGPSAVAVGIGVVVGLAYILLGALMPHDSHVGQGSEIISGVLIVIGFVLSLDTKNGGDATSINAPTH